MLLKLRAMKLGDWYASTFGQAFVGAALLWAAFPPLSLWPLAWIGPIWWVGLIGRARLPGVKPYRRLWLVGFLFWLAALHWMRLPHWMTGFGWVAFCFYLGFYLPVFVGLGRVAVHRLRVPSILAAPILWAGLELARGHLLGGFTMASLGHTQVGWIGLIQLSDLGGAYAVGFVVMFVSACLARMIAEESRPIVFWPLLPALAIVAAAVFYGHLRISRDRVEPMARIALIQGSIDITLRFEPSRRAAMQKQYERLSREAVAEYGEVDLIVWPETVYDGYLVDYDPNLPVPSDWRGNESLFFQALESQLEIESSTRPMRELADALGTSLLLGVSTQSLHADGWKLYNSAVFVPNNGGPLGRYDKMHLVMFGEYIPFADRLDWLIRLTPLSTLGIGCSSGTQPAVFELGQLRMAPNICYESVMPHLIRRQITTLAAKGKEPHVLINLTNDGWFWGSSELDMHLACGVFRAVECRKPFLIAANTGFSAWIDAEGRVRALGPRRSTGTLLAEITPDSRKSPYLLYGDWPAGLCLLACVVVAAVGLANRFRAFRLDFCKMASQGHF